MAKKPSIFISYSHVDEQWKNALRVHLDALQAEDENFVDPWDDERIGAGENWKEEIESAMDRASVAVLLVSADFLVSPFIKREEVPRLLKEMDPLYGSSPSSPNLVTGSESAGSPRSRFVPKQDAR
jgi:hypothetical protein